jgi:hypothetical protein
VHYCGSSISSGLGSDPRRAPPSDREYPILCGGALVWSGSIDFLSFHRVVTVEVLE